MGTTSKGTKRPDERYGWVVLGASVICMIPVVAMQRIAGLIVVEIIDEYHVSRTEAYSVIVLKRLFSFVLAPAVGKLLTKYEFKYFLCFGSLIFSLSLFLTAVSSTYWQLLLFYGCLNGIGFSCISPACTLSVGLHFKKKRTLAVSIFFAATAFAGLINPLLFYSLLKTCNFHGAILILSGLCLHGVAGGMLVRQPSKTKSDMAKRTQNNNEAMALRDYSEEFQNNPKLCTNNVDETLNGKSPESVTVKTPVSNFQRMVHEIRQDLKLFRDGHFLLLLLNRVVATCSIQYFLTLLPDFLVSDSGVNKQAVATILSVSAIGNIMARLIVGLVLDKLPCQKKHAQGIITVMIGLTVFTFHFAHTYVQLVFCSILYCALAGMIIVVRYLNEMELIGPERIPVANGLFRFFTGCANVIGGLLIGGLRDRLGSYKVCINLLGSMAILSGSLWLIEPFVMKYFPLHEPRRPTTKKYATLP